MLRRVAPIRFYFDFISPYAYLAAKTVQALGSRHGRTVEPAPVLFAALLNRFGHKGPAEIPPKRAYVFKNALRLAHAAGLPLAPPPAHPFNPLRALRVVGLEALDEADRWRAVHALFDATWGGGPGVEAPDTLRAVLDAAGLDGAALLARAQTTEAKAHLKHQTEAAAERGVFGVPSFDVDGELFWGYDAYPHIEAHLRGEDPVDPDALARWADLPASAKRR